MARLVITGIDSGAGTNLVRRLCSGDPSLATGGWHHAPMVLAAAAAEDRAFRAGAAGEYSRAG